MQLKNPNDWQRLKGEQELSRQISLEIPDTGHIHDVVLGTTGKVKIVAGFVYVKGEINESVVLAFGRDPLQTLHLDSRELVKLMRPRFQEQYLNYHLIGASLSNSRIKGYPDLAGVPHRRFEVGVGETSQGLGQLIFDVHAKIDGLLDREITNIISMQAFFIKNGYWPKKIHFTTGISDNGEGQIQTIELNGAGAQIIAQTIQYLKQKFKNARLESPNPDSGKTGIYFSSQFQTPFHVEFDRNPPSNTKEIEIDSHFLLSVQKGIEQIMQGHIAASRLSEKSNPFQAHPFFVFYSRKVLGDLNLFQKFVSPIILQRMAVKALN